MIRPLHDWMVVEVLPFDKRSDILEMPTNETAIRKGVVVRCGPKVKGVTPGEHVAYLRWHEEHRPGKQTCRTINEMSEDGKEYAMVRMNDILFVYAQDMKVDI